MKLSCCQLFMLYRRQNLFASFSEHFKFPAVIWMPELLLGALSW